MLRLAMANHKRPWRRALDGRMVDADGNEIDHGLSRQLLMEAMDRIDYLEAMLSDRKLTLRDQAAVAAITGSAAALELEHGADIEDEDFVPVNEFALAQANDLVAKLYPPDPLYPPESIDQGDGANVGE